MNKNAISPVVATALLLVVAVVAVVGFQNWFGTYSSDLFVQSEKGSSSTSNTNIETLVGDQLYFKNTLDGNISIKQIKIGNKECNISLNLTNGVHNISLGNCVKNLTSQVNDITVITDKQIYTKKHLFKDISIVSSSQSLEPVVESQLINNSLLFDGVDDYLSWTPGQEGNRTTATYSVWIKKNMINLNKYIFHRNLDGNNHLVFNFLHDDTLQFYSYQSGIYSFNLRSNQVFKDIGEWINVIAVINTTDDIASERIKLYIDGIKINSFSVENYPSKNANVLDFDLAFYRIGSFNGALYMMDGYESEINFIDGQALGPENFGELKDGKWVPKEYEGVYGTNGFHLDFSNSSNLGEDSSGNENDFTVNGVPVQTIDTPENNFAVFNSNLNNPYLTYSSGNLKLSDVSSTWWDASVSTLFPTTGKYYWEYKIEAINDLVGLQFGLSNASLVDPNVFKGNGFAASDYTWGFILINDGRFVYYHDGFSDTSFTGQSVPVVGDIIGFAYDSDNGNLWVSHNNNWKGNGNPSILTSPTFIGLPNNLGPAMALYHSGNEVSLVNGAQGFNYQPPTEFNPLSSKYLK